MVIKFSLLQHCCVFSDSAPPSSQDCILPVWQPPPTILKLNYDVSWQNQFLFVAIAIIVWNNSNHSIDGLLKHIWCYSPAVGEAMALLEVSWQGLRGFEMWSVRLILLFYFRRYLNHFARFLGIFGHGLCYHFYDLKLSLAHFS